MSVITITGGTGTIGQYLSRLLISSGYEVRVLGRKIPDAAQRIAGVQYALWDIDRQRIDPEAISQADCIIHLAGAGIADGRWTADRKREIIRSRSESAALLVKGLREIPNHVQTVISASATGYYGDDRRHNSARGFTEEDRAADDFLAQTCVIWENSIEPAEKAGKRLVILRTGIVLDTKAGAYAAFVKPLKAGLCTIMGSGRQMLSWIHIEDLCRLYVYALEHAEIRGVYNAVAPEPASNRELMLGIARSRNKFFVPIRIPSFLLRLGLGAMSEELVKSCRVASDKIQEAGFGFHFPDLNAALSQLAER